MSEGLEGWWKGDGDGEGERSIWRVCDGMDVGGGVSGAWNGVAMWESGGERREGGRM